MLTYSLHPACTAFTTERNDLIPEHIILPKQTHSDHVGLIDSAMVERIGDIHSLPNADLLPDTDALITSLPSITIGIRTADCVPILLFDPVHRASAAIHSGWRGTVKKVALTTICAMYQHFRTRPEDLLAVIGPSICPACFEVGEEVVEEFLTANFPPSIILRDTPLLSSSLPITKPHIHLWQANEYLLQEAGLSPSHIQTTQLCTMHHLHRFFSARGDGYKAGRLVSAIHIHPC